MSVALRSLEGRQPRLESHREHGLRGELVQAEVLCPELGDERLPAPRVQEVLVGLDGGGGGEGQEPHGLLHHRAVLRLRLGAEELLGVPDGLQPLTALDQLQVLLQPHLELQAGLQFPEATPVLMTPRQALAQVPSSQAVLNFSGCQEDLQTSKSKLH